MSGRWPAVLAAAAIAAAVAVALILVGSPRIARLERLDQRRAADIAALARWIEHHRLLRGELPEGLGALEPMLPGDVSALDPATGAHYGYERLAGGHFRVCAELSIPDKHAADAEPRPRFPGTNRTMRPVIDPTGRRLCLESADLAGDGDRSD